MTSFQIACEFQQQLWLHVFFISIWNFGIQHGYA